MVHYTNNVILKITFKKQSKGYKMLRSVFQMIVWCFKLIEQRKREEKADIMHERCSLVRLNWCSDRLFAEPECPDQNYSEN